MRKTLSFLKPYKLHIIVAYSLTFIELIVELILPLLLGLMINEGIVNESMNAVIKWGTIILVLAFTSFTAGIINSFYASHTGNHFAYDIREALFKRIQSFTYAAINRFPTSVLVTYFTNDVRQVQNTIFMGLRVLVRAPLMIIGSVIMALIVHPKLAAIFVVVVPLVVTLVIWVLRKATTMFDRVQQKVDQVNSIIQENLLNMRLIKAFVRHRHERTLFRQANQDLADRTRKAFRFVDSSMPLLLLLMNVSIVFILFIGQQQIQAGTTNVGEVVAVVNYGLRIAMSITVLTFITMNFSRMQASAARLSEVLTLEDTETVDHAEGLTTIDNGKVQFEHVSFTYPDAKKPVLTNISFHVNARETVVVIGATGSGKTTLFQLLPRLYEPDQGRILIDHRPLGDYALKPLRDQIGYVPQSPLLFSGSVADNIKWGKPNATDEEMVAAAKAAQIHDVIMRLPHGYETEVSQRGVNLSGGQKQRLSIARALVRQPKLLLLDDCTSALDYLTEAKLLSAVAQYDCSIILITQKITTARHADRILLLDAGQVAGFGTDEELMEHSQLYREIVQSQTDKELRDVT